MKNSSIENFISLCESTFGKNYIISKSEISELAKQVPYPNWLITDEYRIGRGKYKVPLLEEYNQKFIVKNVVSVKSFTEHKNDSSYIPLKNPFFEKYGFYNDLKKIIKSNAFYPVFISGESGGGKTFLVEQVCSELKREMIRINFSVETDQSDLIGAPSLINGNITYPDGPVLKCLRNGWILLLDEIDRSNPNNILILNGILEGRGFFHPKTGEYIPAKEGFNVIMTANSKGFGDDSGKYLAQILDTAFLERIPVTFEQQFAPEKTEIKILLHYIDDIDFVEKLVKWARVIRKTYENGGIEEIISTRRLVHIVQAYDMFGKDKMKAIELCVSRFESHTKNAFLDLYTKIDENLINENDSNDEVNPDSDIPF